MIGLGLGFTNPVGTGGVWDVCLCWAAVMWVVLGGVGGWLGQWFGRVVWCYFGLCYNSGIFVVMAGLGICVLCSADTCTS